MTDWLRPGGWIGILGGGQLGRMTAQAAQRLGYRVRVLDPDPQSPAGQVADDHVVAAYDARSGADLARRCAVVTYEFENIPLETARAAEHGGRLYPAASVLARSQNRIREKDAISAAGLATAPYRPVRSVADAERAVLELGPPLLFKTAEGGYDGKGQAVVHDAAEARETFRRLTSGPGDELVAERIVPIAKELSVVGARGRDGSVRCFPPAENHHENGILDWSRVPADVPVEVQRRAAAAVQRLLEAWDVVGLLAVEFFWTADEELLVNETAPRPHNSGHYTIEACRTSQFEQLVRAIAGLPLGNPELREPAAMVNLLGDLWLGAEGRPDVRGALAADVSLHLYGKAEARPGRKMGHITALAASAEDALRRAQAARRSFARTELASPS
jgi:5-(carboxyamino)imidazole ribonucleotide synthase